MEEETQLFRNTPLHLPVPWEAPLPSVRVPPVPSEPVLEPVGHGKGQQDRQSVIQHLFAVSSPGVSCQGCGFSHCAMERHRCHLCAAAAPGLPLEWSPTDERGTAAAGKPPTLFFLSSSPFLERQTLHAAASWEKLQAVYC